VRAAGRFAPVQVVQSVQDVLNRAARRGGRTERSG
jgi:hypothetical protein